MTAMLRRTDRDGSQFWDLDGRLIPVLAGGDPAALYPEIPEDLTTLSRDELATLARDVSARTQEVVAVLSGDDADARTALIGELSAADAIAAGQAAMDGVDRINDHLAALDAQEAEQAAALESLATRATTDTDAAGDGGEGDDDESPESDPDTDPADPPEADAAASSTVEVAIAGAAIDEDRLATQIAERLASAIRPRAKRRVPAPGRHTPGESGRGASGPGMTMTLTASGETVTDRDTLSDAFADRMQNMGNSHVSGEKLPIARVRTEFPEDRQLTGDRDHDRGILGRLFNRDTLTGPQALVAAGGICAPPMPSYDVDVFAVADRPVRDSLPVLQAPRGAISYLRPLGLGLTTGAVGAMTEAQDAAITNGTPDNTKACLRVTCNDVVTAEIEARYRCLTIGNFDVRTWPERIAAYVELAEASWARMTEARDTNFIKTNSTAVTHPQIAGALTDLITAILKARAGMISRHRMSQQTRFRVVLPEFIVEALPVDQLRGGRDELLVSAVEAKLERYGVSVTWYKDGVTGGTSQVYGAQSAGALIDFPTSVQWGFFPEGSFAALDAGTLDLGLVRDSTLNKTNDYQLFAESFEGMAYQGIESLWVTSTVCYSGQVQEAGAVMACAADQSGPEGS